MGSEVSSEMSAGGQVCKGCRSRLHWIAKCFWLPLSALLPSEAAAPAQSRGRGHSLAPVATLGTPSSALLHSYWLRAPPAPSLPFQLWGF